MKNNLDVICCFIIIFSAVSCATLPTEPPEWRYEKDAIELQVNADPQLNLYEGIPHTLLMCVYQLRDPNVFKQLSSTEDGLYKLLECSVFDAAVAGTKKLIIHPGVDSTYRIDRSEGAKYVALVAGYFVLQEENMVRMFEVPVKIDKKGLIKRKIVEKADKLKIDLTLGARQIIKVEKDKTKKDD